MSKLKIATIMSTYNGEVYLSKQLDSILEQSFDEERYTLCIYIRDDGSSDRTAEIIQEYAEKYPTLIKYLNDDNENIGVKHSFFRLLSNVCADYYFFSDQDDIWEVDKISKFMKVFENIPSNIPSGVYSDLWVVDKDGFSNNRRMKNGTVAGQKVDNYLPVLLTRYLVTGASFAINRVAAQYAKQIPNNVISNVRMHDSFLALLVAMLGNLIYIDEPLVKYRQHDNNVVGATFRSRETIFSKILQFSTVKQDKYQQILDFYLMANLFSEDILEHNQKIVSLINEYVTTKNVFSKFKALFPLRNTLSAKTPLLSLLFYVFVIKFSQNLETKG